MEFKDLTEYGWPGYGISESGIVQTPKGKWSEVDGNGQVNMKDNKGRTRNHKIAKLVATAFLPAPETEDHKYIVYLDGDRENTHYTNLAWSTKRTRVAEKRADILVAITQGLSVQQIVDEYAVSEVYVRKCASERLKELEARQV